MKNFKSLLMFFGLVFVFTGILVGCKQSSNELTKIKVAEVTHSFSMPLTMWQLPKDS